MFSLYILSLVAGNVGQAIQRGATPLRAAATKSMRLTIEGRNLQAILRLTEPYAFVIQLLARSQGTSGSRK